MIASPTKKWLLAERRDQNLLKHLLLLRGVSDPSAFLEPKFPEHLHDPFLMKGMKAAIDRLVGTIKAGEPIGVFADYDTDGTPGAALLIDGLRQLGVPTRVYIATRQEGYGLSEKGLLALKSAGARVVITIDLGITAAREAQFAKEEGIDLIITDHHLVQADRFPAAAWTVINPKQTDCPYPFKELCGAGIIWKLLGALLTTLAKDQPKLLRGRNPEAIWRWALDLAAIATICDMVPLVGENRVIANFGLKVLAKTRRPGLKALMAVAGTDTNKLSPTAVGFQIGPRINAPTRLGLEAYRGSAAPGPQPSVALACLLSESDHEAAELAERLSQLNKERQEQLKATLTAALAKVEDEGLNQRKVMVLAGEDWPAGIVGLVASRLMERYGRPTIVLSLAGDQAVGSARSIDGFPLIDALNHCQRYLVKFGGHTKAAGLTVERSHLEALADALVGYADDVLDEADLGPHLHLDGALGTTDLTIEQATMLERLSPFGLGNPRPTFLLANVKVVSSRLVGAESRHLKLAVQPLANPRLSLPAIGFDLGERANELANQPIDLAVQLGINQWQGTSTLDLRLLDFRPTVEN